MKRIKIGILTISDKCSEGKRKDTAGPAIKEFVIKELKWCVAKYEILPDEKILISKKLQNWCDEENLNIIFTTGGTGLGPRDKTPEATKEVIHFEVPGIAEILRLEGYKKTPYAVLSRAVCGVRNKTLIINLPGSENAVKENLQILLQFLPHALDIISGRTEHKNKKH